ncbi:hypothetical protein QO010_001814 [Caulobacter ginsengisoli]|uniref:Uncharacterized protein n=1 Tax=Caulobacter ginsengisoli TaxID=400775 RepID=A0ABU0IPV6_9CAUL|nr:hypothetical protein [Caulobacter ginsengisoli]MDQ0464043.1 hypothetical protein [Caulobacter ginsengisoli]
MRHLTAAILGALAVLTMGAASGPPQWLVNHVREEINDGFHDPNDPDSRPLREPPARMFKRVDINGDRIADWKVDFDGEPGWCGTGGCRMELWLGHPQGGLTPVWDAGVREFRLKPGREGATIDVDFHGSACGAAGVTPCPRRFVWDLSEMAFLPAVNAKGDGFLAGLPIPALDLTLSNAPSEVQAEARAMAKLCLAAGGSLDDGDLAVTRLPDLNGDGVRDWAVGSIYPQCQEPKDAAAAPPALAIMVSDPSGRFTLAWSAAEPEIAFDIATKPATMLELTVADSSCGLYSPANCPRRPLRWNETTRRLEPAR